MPFEVKIRPVDFNAAVEPARYDIPVKFATRLRFKRLYERQFLKAPLLEKNSIVKKDRFEEFELSSLCLTNMVENFMEDINENHVCGKNLCRCMDSSDDDEFDSCSCFGELNHSSTDACENLKSLVPCQSVTERNVLADTARIVDQMKITKQNDDGCLNIVVDGLIALGYNASVCKSHWEKSSTCPAGEYEYVDVIIGDERLIVDIDFRTEFEIARATKTYKSILQTLPVIFVGKSDRLQRIISIVTEAAKQSLKQKGMPLPPWRKAEYVKAKWLSAYTARTPTHESLNAKVELPQEDLVSNKSSGEESSGIVIKGDVVDGLLLANDFDKNEQHEMAKIEQPVITIKNSQMGVKKMGGLTCIIDEKP